MTHKEIENLLRDTYIEYKYELKKYLKDVSHFSKDGNYQECLKKKYERNR